MNTDRVTYRTARRDDLFAIVRLLADNPLGARRERFEEPLLEAYRRAFAAIDRDAHNELLVAERAGGIVGVLQLTRIPNLTYQGSWRAPIEGVRIAASVRGQGIGCGLVEEAIARTRKAGCRMVQLTTDKARPEAFRFYEALGFIPSHEGLKLSLVDARQA